MHGGLREYIAKARPFGSELLNELVGEQPEGPQEAEARADDPGDYCPRCGASVDETGQTPQGCPFCIHERMAWQRLVRLGAYVEPWREWIMGAKFGGQWRWASRLGEALGGALDASPHEPNTAVVPVPMHWARRWRRGFNQAHLLADAVGRVRGWPLAPVLRRVRYTRPQTAVAPSLRRQNVHDSFRIADVDLSGWTVWLIDDVKTSGATLGGCARLVREAGARCVNVAVVAVADPHGRDFQRI